ncbi:MAG: protein-glutamate O-methyltransferase CheR, partial [Helicobacteraceae bacterium]|nr:protein-glutamate O-methyltransferase CheR [Helicobacteraceae bacterium]
MDRLLTLFYDRTGIRFDRKKDMIVSKIERFFAERGITDAVNMAELFANDRACYQELVNLLTVNETYFFREMDALEIFARAAAEVEGFFRVLSVPCSTGEEAYSIAILLNEACVSQNRYEITAIDLNSETIARAQEGVYSGRSLDRVAQARLRRFFKPLGGGSFRVRDEIRSNINFLQCGLFDPLFDELGGFDFVFCRNLLIYFDQESRLKAEKALFDRMNTGGRLFMGHADFIKNEIG